VSDKVHELRTGQMIVALERGAILPRNPRPVAAPNTANAQRFATASIPEHRVGLFTVSLDGRSSPDRCQVRSAS
jgi:hypothetical protein